VDLSNIFRLTNAFFSFNGAMDVNWFVHSVLGCTFIWPHFLITRCGILSLKASLQWKQIALQMLEIIVMHFSKIHVLIFFFVIERKIKLSFCKLNA
jgi:hypothetical protein